MELDEKVVLTDWRTQWAADFDVLAGMLAAALGPMARRIEHIGSTSVPGLCAKDVVDVQVIVAALDNEPIIGALTQAGFAQRYSDWNLRDHIPAGWSGDPDRWAKLVFATPATFRTGNVHIRAAGSPSERYALLFRDFLRANEPARVAWARFKLELATVTQTLADYGSAKDPATDILLELAERWAIETDWSVADA